MWKPVKQRPSGLQSHQRLRGWNVPEPKCHTDYSPETPRKQVINFSRKCLMSSSAGSSPTSMDTLSRELYTERNKGPRLVLSLLNQKPLSQYWQSIGEILLTRILSEIRKGKVQLEEQLQFPPRFSTALQLASLADSINRNVDEGKLTGPVFVDVPTAFDTVCIEVILYKSKGSIVNRNNLRISWTLLSYTFRLTYKTAIIRQ